MAAETHRKTVLPDHTRILTERIGNVRSVSLGVWFLTGSRDESEDESGMSHFIEHMVFKGTKTRTAKQLAVEMQALGGNFNAYTLKEMTCYSARILDTDLEPALYIVADMLQNSKFDDSDIRTERRIIAEEIKGYLDSPDEVAFDLLAKAALGSHPVSRSILGTYESLSTIDRTRIKRVMRHRYTTGRTVIAAAGSVRHDRLVSLVNKVFKFPESGEYAQKPVSVDGTSRIRLKNKPGINQVHICVGCKSDPCSGSKKYALRVFNTVFGDGIGSRLFQKLREEKGLVYNVFTFMLPYRDVGLFGGYLAVHPKNAHRAMDLFYSESEKMLRDGLTKKELDNAKSESKSSLVISLESTSNRMAKLASMEIHEGKHESLDYALSRIDSLKESEIMDMAAGLLRPSKMSLGVVGPVSRAEVESLIQ
jgi:predicted Zn-dependent peptidase